RGKLAALPGLPLDVLFEIFSALPPEDLLRLARVTKALRATLMSRSAAWVWKQSYARAPELPPVPSDTNVPQFVHLMFDRNCHFCNAMNAKRVIWAARVRTCNKCFLNNTFFVKAPRPAVLGPHTAWQAQIGQYIPQSSAKAGRREQRCFRYPTASIVAFTADFERNAVGNMDDASRTAWLREKMHLMKEKQEHAKLCEAWENRVQTEHSARLQKIREQRNKDIVQRLCELGWEEEVKESQWRLAMLRYVNRAQPLTDKGWLKIKDPLIQLMSEVRAKQLERHHAEVLKTRRRRLFDAYGNYLSALGPYLRLYLPGVRDIATNPAVAQLIKNTPYDQAVPQTALRAIFDAMPRPRVEDWREQCEDALVELLSSVTGAQRATTADLSLARTAFVLKDRAAVRPQYLFYPDILHDERMVRPPPRGVEGTPDIAYVPWDAGKVSVSAKYRAAAEEIIECAGLNPASATVADMNA
ncbi:hypothetical protein HDZ31DRAFT_6545, partial [Schizophyllum fasciatum]